MGLGLSNEPWLPDHCQVLATGLRFLAERNAPGAAIACGVPLLVRTFRRKFTKKGETFNLALQIYL